MAVSWCFATPSLVAGAVVAHLAGAGPGGADWRRGGDGAAYAGLRVQQRRAPWFWEITRYPHARNSLDWSALRHAS